MIQSVSLCMVVYNERHRLPSTLLSALKHGVDEICVVDQQSDDGTWDFLMEAARAYPIKAIKDHHYGYCEPSREAAHRISNCDWVLVLDADERISDEFASEMRTLDERGFLGARLQRSFWLAGEHRFTGDYQYRFFQRNNVRYLPEIHTEPQPQCWKEKIYSPEYVGIWHEKSWEEQIRDELAYEKILENQTGAAADRKRELNVHLPLLRDRGLTPQQADEMTPEQRKEIGIS